MINQAKRLVAGGFRALGYEIHPIGRHPQAMPPYLATRCGARLYVTCQEVSPGDLLAVPSEAQVDERHPIWPWQVGEKCRNLEEIVCYGTLEGLTLNEAQACLAAWFEALAVEGQLRVFVPDLDSSFEQWRRAEWSEQTLADADSEALSAFAAIYGRQRVDGPHAGASARSYRMAHKSGYNERLLKFLLARAGFSEVTIASRGDYLLGTGIKKVNKGERQVAPTLESIRVDHRARYELAARHVPEGARVLDVACGVGYGSWILAQQTAAASIHGIDIHEGAIAYAQEFYHHERIAFARGDALADPWPEDHYDVAVSFETIEHLAEAPAFLGRLRRTLKPDGRLICSTPNEEKLPFDPKRFTYHVRHYTPVELEALLTNAGFEIEGRFAQVDQRSGEMVEGWDGKFHVAVCRRV